MARVRISWNPINTDRAERRFIDNMDRTLMRTAFGKLRREIPVDTGRLRRAFKFRKAKAGRELHAGFTAETGYWIYQRDMRKRMRRIWNREVRKAAPAALKGAIG